MSAAACKKALQKEKGQIARKKGRPIVDNDFLSLITERAAQPHILAALLYCFARCHRQGGHREASRRCWRCDVSSRHVSGLVCQDVLQQSSERRLDNCSSGLRSVRVVGSQNMERSLVAETSNKSDSAAQSASTGENSKG